MTAVLILAGMGVGSVLAAGVSLFGKSGGGRLPLVSILVALVVLFWTVRK